MFRLVQHLAILQLSLHRHRYLLVRHLLLDYLPSRLHPMPQL
jgi:hypothetical protein